MEVEPLEDEVAALPLDLPGVEQLSHVGAPRWLVILAWSMGLAALYVLLSLAHAALVERSLTVDVGFGRSLAFWIGTIYLALLGWGFLPARPTAWYARRALVVTMWGLGAVGFLVSAGFAVPWLLSHWVTAIGTPVAAAAVVLMLLALGVLWLAGRDERAPDR